MWKKLRHGKLEMSLFLFGKETEGILRKKKLRHGKDSGKIMKKWPPTKNSSNL